MILVYFGDCWDDLWRRRQQLAYRLAQTDLFSRVVYVEHPLPATSFLKFIAGHADFDAIMRWKRILSYRSWTMPVADKITVLSPFTLLPSARGGRIARAVEMLHQHQVRAALKRSQADRQMVWVSHPWLPKGLLSWLRPNWLWYDCTEDFSSWPELSPQMRSLAKENDAWLTTHADVVSAVSQVLFEEKRRINPHTYWLPNAVDTDLFLKRQNAFEEPAELRQVRRPILAFVGALMEWAHDWNLLDAVVTMRPEWTFLLLGHSALSARTREMLNRHPGILCVGQRPYRQLPHYLAYADACFSFYRRERANDTRNSQKLLLYFAAGKPVISTSSADIAVYSEHVFLADTPREFIIAVEEALRTDSSEKRQARQEIAQTNSWTARLEQVMEILGRNGILGDE